MNINFNRKSLIKTITDWGKILVLLLDEVVVILAIFLILHFLGIKIPLEIVIAVGVIAGIVIFVIHVAVIPSFHRRKVTGQEGMIGQEGVVIKALTPAGTVLIKGEYWSAKTIDDNIEVGKTVEVVELKNLVLKVKRKEV